MSASKTSASRAATLGKRTTLVTVKQIDNPAPALDILESFKNASAPRKTISNSWIIDVLPNFMTLIMYIMLTSSHHSKLSDSRDHPKSTTATIAAYHLAIVYAFVLLNDMYVRPSPSAHATSWLNETYKHDFAQFLMTLPVPEFLVPVLSQLFAAEPASMPNLFFVPSAAGFDFARFYGKFLPLSFFTVLHDISAELPGNSKRMDIFQELFTRPLYACLNPASTANPKTGFSSVIGDILGTTIDSTTATIGNIPSTKFFQIFSSVFNPVLFRDYQRRSSLASISLALIDHKTHAPNFYDLVFCANRTNLAELRVVLSSVASTLNGSIPFSKNLGDVIASASGSDIFNHAYSTVPLPSSVSNPSVDLSTLTSIKMIDPTTFASTIAFLQPVNLDSAAKHKLPVPQVTSSAGTIPPDAVMHLLPMPFNLVKLTNSKKNVARPNMPNDFVIFNELENVFPRHFICDVTSDALISGPLVTLSGKVIYSFELDGTTIELPNANKALAMQNVLFADSAIQYRYTIPDFVYYKRPASDIPPPLQRRLPNRNSRLPGSSLFIDRTTIIVPQFDPEIIDTTTPTSLPGLTHPQNWNWIRKSLRFMGQFTNDRRSGINSNDDSVPGATDSSLYIWSPYSYTPVEDQDDSNNDLALSRSYFLTNLRTIFGTQSPLVEVTDPVEALPVV